METLLSRCVNMELPETGIDVPETWIDVPETWIDVPEKNTF